MAKNSIDAYGAKGKSNVLFFDPEDLVLVTDETSPLYDERVHLPINERMVLNIMHQGVQQAIVVAKNPETGKTEVVAGRQRTKNCREANKRLMAQGREPHLIPALPKRGEGADLASVMVSENEIRDADTPLGRAKKMQRLQNHGKDEAALGLIFGCSQATVRSTLALLDCCAAVKTAVDGGKIGIGHAQKLAKLPPEEQRQKVAELVAAADGAKGHERARRQRAVVDGDVKPRMRTRKVVEERLAASTGEVADALRWVLGQEAAVSA